MHTLSETGDGLGSRECADGDSATAARLSWTETRQSAVCGTLRGPEGTRLASSTPRYRVVPPWQYRSVMDLPAEFYLQTVDTVFVKHALPKGEMKHRGAPVNLSAIRRVGLLTVEG